MKTTLYEIAGNIRELVDSLESGEVSDEQIAQLETLGLTLDTKIDSCCGLIREWESYIAVRQSEIDRLKAGMDAYSGSIKRLKKYMQDNLETIGQTKHETPLFKVRIQKNPPGADLDGTLPPELLDKKYLRIKYEPDNKAAIESWKETGENPRGFIIRQGCHLRIQ